MGSRSLWLARNMDRSPHAAVLSCQPDNALALRGAPLEQVEDVAAVGEQKALKMLQDGPPCRTACSTKTIQRAQYGLIKQYTLNHILDHYIIYAIFLN